MDSENFYSELPSFTQFSGVVEEHHFHRVPSDWVVIITDVKGSTRAIEAGRYRDVNMVGASAIACLHNVIGDRDLPFVFGGDGATMVVPPSVLEPLIEEMLALKKHSQESFGLDLRVGAVEVKDIEAEGAEVQVAKFELVPGKVVAVLRGGGVTLADAKVKDPNLPYEIHRDASKEVDLNGLSCRWEPIPSRNGKVLSLLVVAQPGSTDAYRKVLEDLDSIYHGDMDTANPVSLTKMRYRSLSDCLRSERKNHDSVWSAAYFKGMIGVVYSILVFKMKMPAVFFNSKEYTESIPRHSDYRKFDDALRMIVDCSDTQSKEIRESLEALRKEGLIYFGIHQSDSSLMTCYVRGVDEGKHIHFVDGGDGGYTMASKELKAQMKGNP